MGGQISIIKRHDHKITGVSAYTGTFSNVVYDKEFLTNPNNKLLTDFLNNGSHGDYFEDRIDVDSYGLFIVDYDNKTFYCLNGYSSYIEILPSCLLDLDEQDGVRSPVRDLFDNDDVCIRSMECILIEKGETVYENKFNYKITNKTTKDLGFKSMDDVVNWIDGDEFSSNPFKNKKGNKFIENERGNTVYNSIFIDIEKYGWVFRNYPEGIEGYVELYNQLIKDGYNITPTELTQWSEYVGEDDETGETIFSTIRDNTLTELGI
jgi:hypothetical protein